MAMRLDKYLSNMGVGTRSEAKKAIQYGKVSVNGVTIKKIDYKVDEQSDEVRAYNKVIGYAKHITIMLNKPAGVITATEDKVHKTVFDLITHKRKKDLTPVGRLDKDTEGLLILTSDGQMSHRLLSPKKHVDKVYFAKISGMISQKNIKEFAEGITLEDGYKTMPAVLNIVTVTEETSEIEVTIREGKYHQVKRMFEAVGTQVIYLKRIKMGGLSLDVHLKPGCFKELDAEDIARLEQQS